MEEMMISKKVNGENSFALGWMVLIHALNFDDWKNYESCGKYLLNSQFVIAASHCVGEAWDSLSCRMYHI